MSSNFLSVVYKYIGIPYLTLLALPIACNASFRPVLLSVEFINRCTEFTLYF